MISFNEADGDRIGTHNDGYNYIKLELNPKLVRGGQQEVRISGVKIAKRVAEGMDSTGLPRVRLVIKGGSVVFNLNEDDGRFYGSIVDDREKGEFSPEGYNRDFLATHWKDEYFRILDLDVRADVKRRYYVSQGKDYVPDVDPKDKEIIELKRKLDEAKPSKPKLKFTEGGLNADNAQAGNDASKARAGVGQNG